MLPRAAPEHAIVMPTGLDRRCHGTTCGALRTGLSAPTVHLRFRLAASNAGKLRKHWIHGHDKL
jgi:hypothetical protein